MIFERWPTFRCLLRVQFDLSSVADTIGRAEPEVSESTALDDQTRNLDFRLKPNTVPRHLSVKVVGSPDIFDTTNQKQPDF
jgi:hypothetical protein